METSNVSKSYLSKILSQGKRFDGRGLLDLKNLTIEYGVSNKSEGSARVKLGKTEVIAGVKLSPGAPYPDSLDKGNLIVSGDLLPLASPRFEMGPPGFDGIEMPRLVDRMIRESKMIDFTKLVIKEKELVWNVYIDIYPLNDDGALIDAASIACVAALHNAVIPNLDENNRVDYDKKSSAKLPLVKDIMPLSITAYKLGQSIFIQPTREEEEACDAKVTLGMSKQKDSVYLHSCQKGWPTTFTLQDMKAIMDFLPKKYDEIYKQTISFIK